MTFRPAAALVSALALAAAAPAGAQGIVGVPVDGGLHWHVAAPQGASWSLECRFRPVTVRGRMLNRYETAGAGSQPGRLPGDNGRCALKKTGGAGPVGVALVKNGQPTANGTADPARAAFVDVF